MEYFQKLGSALINVSALLNQGDSWADIVINPAREKKREQAVTIASQKSGLKQIDRGLVKVNSSPHLEPF